MSLGSSFISLAGTDSEAMAAGGVALKSTNFEFLRAKWPPLASLAGFAEHYCYADPESALIKLRLLIEQFVEHIYATNRLTKPFQASLNDLLNDQSNE